MNIQRVLFLLGAVLLISRPAYSELITLNTGEVIRGNIIKITPVYVRIKNFGPGKRHEYLVDEIAKIEPDKTQESQVSELAIQNLQMRESSVVNKKLKKVAMKKATEIVSDAMKELNVKSLNNAPKEVRIAAMDIANELIMEALSSSNIEKFEKFDDQINEKAKLRALEMLEKNKEVIEKSIMNNEFVASDSQYSEMNALEGVIENDSIHEDGENKKEIEPKYIEKVIQSGKHQEVIELIPVEEDLSP